MVLLIFNISIKEMFFAIMKLKKSEIHILLRKNWNFKKNIVLCHACDRLLCNTKLKIP